MDNQVSFANVATFQPHATLGHVLCCLCGTSIPPNPSNMCINCIRSQVDISDGLQKQVTVLWCKGCGRYLQPPKHWVRAELESKELLTFCIKKIKGLSKVKLIDAGFIWTEPHSKRLKVKMTVQAEVFNGTILQQSFVVDYVIENNMCADCNRRNANPNSWNACVQLRQHVYHKRTFLYLEQLILKHNAASNCIKITDIHEGVDFFYGQRGHALKFIDFLQAVVPLRYRHDKQLVSHDTHNNTYNYKYTFSVEIAPLCKDDLVVLPHKLASGLGNLGPITIVLRVSSHVTLIDPLTLRIHSMDAQVYWRQPFMAAMSMKQLVEYVVLDVEPIDPSGQRGGGGGQHSASSSSYASAGQGTYGGSGQQGQQGQPGSSGRYLLADVQVARVSDFGRNDTVFFARTHLGHLLHPGDRALGYDLSTAQLVTLDFEAHVNRGGRVPDVVLVRKSFEEKRRRRRERGQQRLWKLKRLDMEVEDEASAVGGAAGAGPKRGRGGRAAQQSANDEEAERERFMQEIEEDPELRSRINVYKDKDAIAAAQAQQPHAGAVPAPAGLHSDGMSDDDEGDLPEVPLEELLDDLEGLNIDGEDDEDNDGADDEDMEDA